MRRTLTTAFFLIVLLAQGGFLLGDEVGSGADKARLQKALFAEEAERDLPKAAKEYERLVAEYTEARKIGLSALYRLAEVRRKQQRNDEAAKLYQRIVAEFSETPEARLSRENLIALGIGLPVAPKRIPDDPDETKELRRLMMLAKNSPERMWDEVPLALNNSGNQTTSPLSKAARRGWLRVVKFLLAEHKKSGRKQHELDLALYSTAISGQTDSCRLLTAHGATLSIAKHALVQSIESNYQSVGDWLLEEGVTVNSVGQGHLYNLDRHRVKQRDVYSGEDRAQHLSAWVRLSPLSAAIAADDPEWIDRLLKLGADVNHQGEEGDQVEISPLSVACWRGHAPLVKRLLDLGADPNSQDRIAGQGEKIRKVKSKAEGWRPLHYAAGKPKIVAELLAAGADAQCADSEGFSPLHAAAYLNSAKSCEALLGAGAASDPAAKLGWLSDQQWTPIMLASANAQQEDGGASAKEIIQMLIKFGADVTPGSASSRDIVDLCPVARLRFWLAESIRYPGLARSKGITLALPAAAFSHSLVAHPEDGSVPPTLATVLLGWVSPVSIRGDEAHQMDRGLVRRIDKSGQIQKLAFEVAEIDSHPELQWGDILEFSPVDMDARAYVHPLASSGRPSVGRSRSIALDPEAYLKLFSRMEANISIVWPDRPKQEITLRGGLRVYDPGRAEAPFVTPGALIQLLGGSFSQNLRITRSEENGGETIDVPRDRKLAVGIRFFDGDVLVVDPLDPVESKNVRKRHIQLLEPESGFRWTHWVTENRPAAKNDGATKDVIVPAIYPTLLQFLTEFYLPLETLELQSMSETLAKENDFKKWNPDEIASAVNLSGVAPWATIRHPNLQEIWIDRLDGERIRVSLAELVAKTNDETPNDFYYKADMELKPGDVVELRLNSNSKENAREGFDPKIIRFIEKALSYDIELTPINEPTRTRRVKWTPFHWFETSVGPIAIGRSSDSPFVMNVEETSRALIGRTIKWGLRERWLRQGCAFDEQKGHRNYGGKNRMGGSGSLTSWSNHGGLDGRGLPDSLRPRRFSKVVRPRTSSVPNLRR